jgi:hypothetical protein
VKCTRTEKCNGDFQNFSVEGGNLWLNCSIIGVGRSYNIRGMKARRGPPDEDAKGVRRRNFLPAHVGVDY